MMKKGDYFEAKESTKGAVMQGIAVLAIFITIFMSVIFRFAIRTGTNEGFFALVPTGNEAYDVARDYIKSNSKFPDAEFRGEDFQYSKNSDSVYVVKSHFETITNYGQPVTKKFTATLRYNGGSSTNDRNWTLVGLEEN